MDEIRVVVASVEVLPSEVPDDVEAANMYRNVIKTGQSSSRNHHK